MTSTSAPTMRGRLLFGVALLLAAGILALRGPSAHALGIGERAPDFSLPSIDGRSVKLSSLRGKVVFIDFWASWCEPCKKEMPVLERLHQRYKDRGVVVLAINIDNSRANAERFLKQVRTTFPMLLDPGKQVAAKYDPPKMPSSFVVDKRGLVRFVNAGFELGDDKKFARELDQLLK